ncbi:TPA: PilW family protein [Vibrio cholerae]|uniref:PilW family protein n=1 Tax=Vibrio TaxID=662 RepID=UPI000496F8C1|nr:MULTISPECIES: prepilin-type N-terminal cleavage/methylation domain-containing protein [Vibrio]MBP8549918.1 pilus assembly protein PilW [Vibrio paracholerae]MCX9475619.1 prepilin-type N-terminal cleavage/methylation domain-containing protein [Vibrio cholerae]MCX9478248.1 prepilin-type N-terminal cleavage/methylation domain-containing protein [Vibrio cholerae]MDA5310610.1 prepilin-type N-terminal cleavage/methylation domain-containing protein [Vibrio cholerae]MDX5008849.1 prepilin-type N-term
MALQSAKQQGNTLIEFMVASLVGAMALAIIGSVFLSNQKTALQRSKEIMLLQQMNSVMLQMKKDIQRAGFDGVNPMSMMLSGSTSIIHTQSDRLAYVYRKSTNKTSNTVYRLDNGMFKYCHNDADIPLNINSAVSGCFNLFDPEQIKVSQFDISNNKLLGSGVESAFISITLAAELKNDPSISHTMSLKVQQRNWQ